MHDDYQQEMEMGRVPPPSSFDVRVAGLQAQQGWLSWEEIVEIISQVETRSVEQIAGIVFLFSEGKIVKDILDNGNEIQKTRNT